MRKKIIDLQNVLYEIINLIKNIENVHRNTLAMTNLVWHLRQTIIIIIIDCWL